MTDTTTLEGVTGGTEADAVAAITRQAVEPRILEPGEIFALPDHRGGLKVVTTDEYAETPRRAEASRSASDAESFVKYVNRHKVRGTEIYAHVLTSAVVAVIDSHEDAEGDPGWQKHRLSLALEHSKEWLAWIGHDLGQNPRGWFTQEEFAEFIEARALDVIEPDHARLIEIATTFEAKKSADFNSSVRLDNGDVKFEFTESTTSRAGQKGDIEVPKELRLALRPYIGGPRVYVYAQFRYRLNGGRLMLGYALVRPEVILETAFADIVEEIRSGKTVTRPAVTEHERTEASVTTVHEGVGDVPIFYGRP